MTIRMST